jgi:gas vesicle protein
VCENSNSGSGNEKHQKSGSRNLLGILIIIVISIFSGFILGLLFAPQSGLKTRKKIFKELKDIIDRGKFALAEARAIGEELLEKSKEKVGKVSSKIKGRSQTDIR